MDQLYDIEDHKDQEEVQHRPLTSCQIIDEHCGKCKEKSESRYGGEESRQTLGMLDGDPSPYRCFRYDYSQHVADANCQWSHRELVL